jgi:hypothetical protein
VRSAAVLLARGGPAKPTDGLPYPLPVALPVAKWLTFSGLKRATSCGQMADVFRPETRDFPCPYIIGYGSSPSRHGPPASSAGGQAWDLPASDAIRLHVMWPSTRQGNSTSHNGAAHVAFERVKTLGPCDV